MKVLVVNNMAPFLWGGAEELAVHLKKNLILAGHQSEILRIPFQWEPYTGIPSQMLIARTMELYNVDHVIALKFPAYMIRHPKKTLWLLHQYRQAYDLYDANQTNIPKDNAGNEIRNIIINGDNQTFEEARKIYTNSAVTQKRLKHYNGYDSEVLLPPINDPELFQGGEYGDYIFAGGRVNSGKRQLLLIEALSKTSSKCKLVVAGPPDSPEDKNKIEQFVEKNNLSSRVKLDLRFLPRNELAHYVNNAAACVYIPFDEDSLGYVSMEAVTAKKALITTTDSGGIQGLVKHNETGWVAEPTAESLAECFEHVYKDKARTKTFGENANDLWQSYRATWPKTIEKLLDTEIL